MEYIDHNGNRCSLSFVKGHCPMESWHVLVLAKFEGSWILTNHPERGLEFPGGKREPGETLEQAAIREVYEETGAVIEKLEWLAEYKVESANPFCKTAFIGTVERLEEAPLFETKGIVLMKCLEIDERFSFIMRDEGMKEMIKKVNAVGKWKN